MNKIENNDDALVVFKGKNARALLRRGYTIIDIKPNRNDSNKTVFVFRKEGNIEQELYTLFHEEIGTKQF